MTSSNFRRLHYALLNTAFCVILIMATPALSFGQNAPPKAILANAAKVQANGQISFCGFYLGMPEADAKTLAAYHGLDNKQWSCEVTPLTKQVYKIKFSLQSVRHLTKGGNTFKDLAQAVANRLGRMEQILDPDEDGYYYKNIDNQCAAITEKGLEMLDGKIKYIIAVKEQEEIDRKIHEEMVKALEQAAKGAVAKLANDMVPIPGKDYSMCKYEVSQALWFAVMGNAPAKFKGAGNPVEHVSRRDCRKFLEKLNALPEVQRAGLVYRLPTGYEWEHACLAGGKGDYGKLADGSGWSRADGCKPTNWRDFFGSNRSKEIGFRLAADLSERKAERKREAVNKVMVDTAERKTAPIEGERRNATVEAERKTVAAHAEAERIAAAERAEAERVAALRAEAERKAAAERAEAERKRLTKIAPRQVAKLATDMVSVPGKDYAICKYEVTQMLWEAVMGTNPAHNKGADLPVENVSWNDCQLFLQTLNSMSEVENSGFTYRLPTADEWEFACLAGAVVDYCIIADGTEITWNIWMRSPGTATTGMGKLTLSGRRNRMPSVFSMCTAMLESGHLRAATAVESIVVEAGTPTRQTAVRETVL